MSMPVRSIFSKSMSESDNRSLTFKKRKNVRRSVKYSLTVGSSADQAISAIARGCKDITVLDICPLTEPYFYLKKSAILSKIFTERNA